MQQIKKYNYLFQFGNNPKLSLVEINSRFPHFIQTQKISEQLYIFESEEIQNPQKLLDTIGGTIRICQYIKQTTLNDLTNSITEFLDTKFQKDKKNVFGISIFPKQKKLLNTTLIKTKKNLKKNFSIRFLNRNFQNLDAGTLYKENVFKKKGHEICLFQKNNEFIITNTIAAQNIEKYAKRDYGKPVRDMEVGMLPPKLALMMLNLTCQKGNLPKKIWDPFCGTGTILIEAGFLDINIVGSDISDNMVKASLGNVQHFFEKERSLSPFCQIFQHDAQKLLNQKIDAEAICTETFLGPIYKRPLSDEDLQKALDAVLPILKDFFENLHKVFTGKKVVIAIPFWRMQDGNFKFIKKSLEIYKNFCNNYKVLLNDEDLLFIRDRQNVGRQILVLEKK